MTEKSGITGITIVLLIAGLVVGGAGAYFYVSGPIQADIANLETEQTQLTTELETLNAQLVSAQNEYDDLEIVKEDLENEIQDISLDIANTRADISAAEHSMEVYTEKIDIYSLMTEPDDGYDVLSFFALSFQYPQGMAFEYQQFQEKPISEDYGTIQGTISKSSRDELIQIVWQKVDFESNAESDVIGLVEIYTEELDAYDEVTYETGELASAEILDHTVYYQSVSWTEGTTNGTTYYAAWYCNLDGLHYRIYYVTETPDNDGFEHYLSTVLCHR